MKKPRQPTQGNPPAASPWVVLRDSSGRMYGRLNRDTRVIEVKRGSAVAQIDLKPHLKDSH